MAAHRDRTTQRVPNVCTRSGGYRGATRPPSGPLSRTGDVMSPALPEPAEHALAVLRRARAGGERFVGALLPGASALRWQAAAVADEWAAANLDTHHAAGPLWVVLGDGASLGVGASTRTAGYVCLVADALRADDAAGRADARAPVGR